MSADMTIEEFCALHHACAEGREWAIANCATMRDVWDSARPDWLLWAATRPGVLSDSEMRLFTLWCARQVQHLMVDPRSLAALDAAERHARGDATDEELAAARSAARDAARAARAARDARDAMLAEEAAAKAACVAARDAAYAAALDWRVAWAAGDALDAAWYAALATRDACAARDAAESAESAQAAWLRENTRPDFSRRAEA